MAVPVSVLRLPRGPEGSSRGFSPASPRFQALLLGAGAQGGRKTSSSPPQAARAALRRRYLRSLAAMRGLPVSFALHERVRVGAVVAAADAAPLAFQVDALRTPLGLQAAALLRCADIIAYAFELPPPATPERGNLPQNKSENGSRDTPERGNLPQSKSENGGGGAPERGNLPQSRSENGSRDTPERGNLPQNKSENGSRDTPERGNLPQNKSENGGGVAPEQGNLPQSRGENGGRASPE